MEGWLAPAVQGAIPETLRLYAVIAASVFPLEGVRYAAVFVFETSGEGRIAWIGVREGLVALGSGCVPPRAAGSWLGSELALGVLTTHLRDG